MGATRRGTRSLVNAEYGFLHLQLRVDRGEHRASASARGGGTPFHHVPAEQNPCLCVLLNNLDTMKLLHLYCSMMKSRQEIEKACSKCLWQDLEFNDKYKKSCYPCSNILYIFKMLSLYYINYIIGHNKRFTPRYFKIALSGHGYEMNIPVSFVIIFKYLVTDTNN